MGKGTRILAGFTLMLLMCVPLFLLDLPREAVPAWAMYFLLPFYLSLYALTMSYALRGYEATHGTKRHGGAEVHDKR